MKHGFWPDNAMDEDIAAVSGDAPRADWIAIISPCIDSGVLQWTLAPPSEMASKGTKSPDLSGRWDRFGLFLFFFRLPYCPGFQNAAVEPRAEIVVATADDFAAVDDDAAVAVVEGGFVGLLEAKGEVEVSACRHFE